MVVNQVHGKEAQRRSAFAVDLQAKLPRPQVEVVGDAEDAVERIGLERDEAESVVDPGVGGSRRAPESVATPEGNP